MCWQKYILKSFFLHEDRSYIGKLTELEGIVLKGISIVVVVVVLHFNIYTDT